MARPGLFPHALITVVLALAVLLGVGPAHADPPGNGPTNTSSGGPLMPEQLASGVMQEGVPGYFDPWPAPPTGVPAPGSSVDQYISPECGPGFYVGADYLLVHPRFSEATLFARGTVGASGLNVTAQEATFSYDSSFRVYGGYKFDDVGTALQFTFTRLPGSSSQDAGNLTPGHFLVDPFGNIAGVAPSLTNPGQFNVGGDHIHVDTDIVLDSYDLDFIKPFAVVYQNWIFKYTAGVRIADMDQSFDSIITSGGSFFASGEYTASFVGAGPKIGLDVRRDFGANRTFSLFANSAASLLVGEYKEFFNQITTVPPLAASQNTDIFRVVPVAEIEMGAQWRPYSWLDVSAGWLFQAWIDLGASGGNFGSYYTVIQNANIMAFDGLFVRAQVTF
jgi:Legionella pneumophila major outer membrane protein precursor